MIIHVVTSFSLFYLMHCYKYWLFLRILWDNHWNALTLDAVRIHNISVLCSRSNKKEICKTDLNHRITSTNFNRSMWAKLPCYELLKIALPMWQPKVNWNWTANDASGLDFNVSTKFGAFPTTEQAAELIPYTEA